MATVTPNFNWPVPTSTDLVKDGATAIEALGDSIDASLVDLKGGTSGQVLSKNSNTDMDFVWVAADDTNAIQNSIVNAKGDLIGASANDTPAILSVGANGETLVADSSTSTGLRYTAGTVISNPILNSAMQIWQRGTTSATTAAIYTADRWQKGSATTYNQSRQVTGDTTNLPNIQYCLRTQRTAGSTSTSAIELSQSMESAVSIPYAGKTVTLSFYARAGANYSSSANGLTAYLYSGTSTDANLFAGGFTGAVAVINTVVTLTTTWQRFTVTGTVGATATQLAPYIVYAPTGTAGANDYFEITGVQIDVGSVALPFRTNGATLQGELAACQRYFYRNTGQAATSNDLGTGWCNSTTNAIVIFRHPITMRVAPTATLSAQTDFYFTWSLGTSTITASQVDRTSVDSVYFRVVTSGLTTGQGGVVGVLTGTTKYIEMSAEL
jgi:hypothetical protein